MLKELKVYGEDYESLTRDLVEQVKKDYHMDDLELQIVNNEFQQSNFVLDIDSRKVIININVEIKDIKYKTIMEYFKLRHNKYCLILFIILHELGHAFYSYKHDDRIDYVQTMKKCKGIMSVMDNKFKAYDPLLYRFEYSEVQADIFALFTMAKYGKVLYGHQLTVPINSDIRKEIESYELKYISEDDRYRGFSKYMKNADDLNKVIDLYFCKFTKIILKEDGYKKIIKELAATKEDKKFLIDMSDNDFFINRLNLVETLEKANPDYFSVNEYTENIVIEFVLRFIIL